MVSPAPGAGLSRAFVVLLLPLTALAGRPLVTEDASTLDDKACQLESWVDRTRGNVTDLSFVPACSWLGVEWQAGAVRTRLGGRSATSSAFVQGKHAFRDVGDGTWGIGLVAGLARELGRENENGWGDSYFIVPVSVGLGENKDSRALLHLNVGAARDRSEGRNLTRWGLAIEKPVTPRLSLLAEAFGMNASKPFLRAGGRYAVTGKLALDFTVVTRAGAPRDERFVSAGFHLETDPFLP